MNANSAAATVTVRRRPVIKEKHPIQPARDPKNKERMDTGLLKVFFPESVRALWAGSVGEQ